MRAAKTAMRINAPGPLGYPEVERRGRPKCSLQR